MLIGPNNVTRICKLYLPEKFNQVLLFLDKSEGELVPIMDRHEWKNSKKFFKKNCFQFFS